MTSALAPLAKGCLPPSGLGELAVPSPVMAEGEHAATRYVEFFTAQIRNPNTRAAYARAASAFFAWCEQHGLSLPAIGPVHVATCRRVGRGGVCPEQHLRRVHQTGPWAGNPYGPPAFTYCAMQHSACALASLTLSAQAAATQPCRVAAFLGRFLPKLGGGLRHRPFFAVRRKEARRVVCLMSAASWQHS